METVPQKGRLLKRRSAAGFTLMEVVIALAILAIAFFGMVSVVTYTSRMNAATHERVLAMRAAERKIEQMLATDWTNIFTSFSDYSASGEGMGWEQVQELDLLGIPHPGLQYFTPKGNIPNLTMVTGYTYPSYAGTLAPKLIGDRQAVLFVRFPLDSATTVNENGAGSFAGLATANLDLNRDGVITGGLDPATCLMLPVMIEVYWKSVIGGNQTPGYLSYKYVLLKKT